MTICLFTSVFAVGCKAQQLTDPQKTFASWMLVRDSLPSNFNYISFWPDTTNEHQEKLNSLLNSIQQNPVGSKLFDFIKDDLTIYASTKREKLKAYRPHDSEILAYMDQLPLEKILLRVSDTPTCVTRLRHGNQLLSDRELKNLQASQRGDQVVIEINRQLLELEMHNVECLGPLYNLPNATNQEHKLFQCGCQEIPAYFVLSHEFIHVLHALQSEEDYEYKKAVANTSEWPIYLHDTKGIQRSNRLWLSLEEQRTVIGVSKHRPVVNDIPILISEYLREHISDYSFRLAVGLRLRYAYQGHENHFVERSLILDKIFGQVNTTDDNFIFIVDFDKFKMYNSQEVSAILNLSGTGKEGVL